MRRFGWAAGLALLTIAGPALAAGDMSVATFLVKADALKAKGIGALMSSDMGLLKKEVKAASLAYRARLTADKEAGKPAHSCPPKKASMNSNEFLAHLRSYPATARPKTTITTAMFDLMKKRYPC